MVDLTRTEAQMLAEIKHDAWTGYTDVPSVKSCRVEGRTPAELLPTLTRALSSCYAHVVDEHVSYDLIGVVKKALGNAYKWGNKRDPDKLLIVTAVMTGTGAVVKISDQGKGFDVSHVVRDGLFTRKGSGLTRFRKTSSVISFADGGRTLLVRFLCDTEAENSATGMSITATGAGRVNGIHLHDLRPGDQVKVKGIPEPNGNLLASKVTVRPLEDLTVIEAPLQQARARAISLLNLNVELSEKTELVDANLTPVGFDRLTAGQDVWLTGRYVPGEGLADIKIKIRPGQKDRTAGLRGIIEAINYTDGTLRIAGITIVTDDRTEVRDTRRLNCVSG
jgi:hypothetical protein